MKNEEDREFQVVYKDTLVDNLQKWSVDETEREEIMKNIKTQDSKESNQYNELERTIGALFILYKWVHFLDSNNPDTEYIMDKIRNIITNNISSNSIEALIHFEYVNIIIYKMDKFHAVGNFAQRPVALSFLIINILNENDDEKITNLLIEMDELRLDKLKDYR